MQVLKFKIVLWEKLEVLFDGKAYINLNIYGSRMEDRVKDFTLTPISLYSLAFLVLANSEGAIPKSS